MALRKKVAKTKTAVMRVTGAVRQRLESLVFSRYPRKEWGTFFLFGTHETPDGVVMTIVDLIEPKPGDLDLKTAITRFNEPYSLRAALEKEKRGLCVGVIHSHPQNYEVSPSAIDDDMDSYFRDYFPAFGKETAYFSLIFSRTAKGHVRYSGRGWNKGQEFRLAEMVTVSTNEIRREEASGKFSVSTHTKDEYRERFEELYGAEAAARLRKARVAIIGVSGTGSPAAHVLARAGVENFVLVDPQRMEKSNLERMHGSYAAHFTRGGRAAPFKVEAVRDLIKAINPKASVTCIAGNMLQPLARYHIVGADLAICCTDTNHSRTAISELAYRYLVPAIDVGVIFESQHGYVTGEVGRITVYSPGAPCAYCLGLVDSWRATVELMSEAEKKARREQARLAGLRGDNANNYWKDIPEIPTVGHFTSLAGALVASYAIGWLTGKFAPPHRYFEFNILAPGFGYVGFDAQCRSGCYCETLVGHADQAAYASLISAPSHWANAELI